MSEYKLSDYLRSGPFMAEYAAFFGSEAGHHLLRALEPFAKPGQPQFPLSPGQAEYLIGVSNGATFVLGLVGKLRELREKLGSSNQESQPTYSEADLLKAVWGYDDAGKSRS